MKKNKILLLFFIFVFGVFCEPLNAQFGRFRKFPKPIRTKKESRVKQTKNLMFIELKLDLEDWIDNNVFPEMIKYKNFLDSSMTPEDLKKVDSLRYLNHEIINKITQIKKSKDKDYKKSESEIIRYDHREIIDAVKPYRIKYMKVLDSIYLSVKTKDFKWEDEASDFIVGWIEKNKYDIKDKEKKSLEVYWHFDEKMQGTKFMLWDGRSFIW